MRHMVEVKAKMNVKVVCENCQNEFVYPRNYQASSSGRGNVDLVTRNAWQVLFRNVAVDVRNNLWGVKRCSDCKRYQSWMTDSIKNRWGLTFAIPVFLIVAIIGLVNSIKSSDLETTGTRTEFSIVTMGIFLVLAVAIAVVVYRFVINRVSPQNSSKSASTPANRQVAFEPDLPQLAFMFGQTEFEAGRFDWASEFLHYAILLKPDFAEAYRYIGLRANVREQGIQNLEKYIEITGNTGDTEVQEKLEEFRSKNIIGKLGKL